MLIVVAIVAAYATYLQWDAAEKALDFAKRSASDSLAFARQSAIDTGNDTKAALKISDRLATSAERQTGYVGQSVKIGAKNVEIANEAFQASLESQVAVYDADIEDLEEGKIPKTRMLIRNSGSHQITGVFIESLMTVTGRNDKIAVERGPPAFIGKSNTVIPADSSAPIPIKADRILTAAGVQAIREGIARVYLFGQLTYKDATGRHVRHFCTVYYGQRLPEGQLCETKPDS